MLSSFTDQETVSVNSLHGQGVDRIASGVNIEAIAEDGVIEAFKVCDTDGFAYAVQWHPEWKVLENPLSLSIFRAFGDACREYAQKK